MNPAPGIRNRTCTAARTAGTAARGKAGTQLGLFRRRDLRGGRRRGAGRKPKGEKAGLPHRSRERITRHDVVHVTLRIADDLVVSMRQEPVAQLLGAIFREARQRPNFRLVQFSVQALHLHLIVEANDARALGNGVRALAIRVARRLNQLVGRRGRAFVDRYFARVARTPRATRNFLVYVLQNARHHPGTGAPRPGRPWWDARSSARWFEGWKGPALLPPPGPDETPPVAKPRSWLLRKGWRRCGLIDPCEGPADG